MSKTIDILMKGNEETLSATVESMLEPEEIDRILAYLNEPREYVTQ